MKWTYFILLSSLLYASYAMSQDLYKAPMNFNFENKLAIYTDFKKVESKLKFDLDQKKVVVISTIEFTTSMAGYPIFDLVPDIKQAQLNGNDVSVKAITAPEGETKYRYIDQEVSAGQHTLVIENEISNNIQFSRDYVSFAMWMSDLTDRKYIEQYLPTNLEYDQYQLNLHIKIHSLQKMAKHILYTNGKLTAESDDSFSIQFPSYFTSSSFYLHMTKMNRLPSEKFNFISITGRHFPISLYARSSWSISGVQEKIKKILTELEQNFGPWPHPDLTVYIAGLGGMEHSGATVTSEDALGHELTHSYFARGVMPLNGNAGWMDEAIASWRDNGFPKVSQPNFNSTTMANHSQYRRYTDRKAYREGANFMAFLNDKLFDKSNPDNSFMNFLKFFHVQYTHKNISTEIFKKELESYSGEDFTQEFNQYIYGYNINQQPDDTQTWPLEENPNHPRLTIKQLQSLL